MKIILFSGKAQHGKDTAAMILSTLLEKTGAKSLHIAFADYVKFVCGAYYQWDGAKDEHGRRLLQTIGTDLIRGRDENFWVDTVIRFIKVVWEDYDFAFITDCRFPNEIRRWRESGITDIVTVRVQRPDFDNGLSLELKNHASETSLDGYPFDFFLVATNLEELQAQCEHLSQRIISDYRADTSGI
jgi:hypothetical protein